MRGTDNLREYLQEAILPKMMHNPNSPPMPLPGHKSHLNNLKVRPESWRRLESMYLLQEECQFATAVSTWAESKIPRRPLEEDDEDPVSGVSLTVPCPNASRYEIPLYKETRPDNIARLFKWIDTYPLTTVERTMHLLHPELKKWRFSLPDDYHSPGDINIFQHFMWKLSEEGIGRLNPAGLRVVQRKQVVIAFQPPWVLSPQDMKAFVRCRSYPTYRAPGHAYPTELQSEERLWGRLWDLCVHRNTPWFVLTSYHQWVFGRFSDRWTAAHITDIYEWNASSPTIIECLAFWTANAMDLTNFALPQVPEPIHLPPLPDAIHPADVEDPAVSESSWTGKNSEAPSSAQLRAVSPELSQDGLEWDDLVAPAQNYRVSQEFMQGWMSGVRVPYGDPNASQVTWVSRWEKNRLAFDHAHVGGEWLFSTGCTGVAV